MDLLLTFFLDDPVDKDKEIVEEQAPGRKG